MLDAVEIDAAKPSETASEPPARAGDGASVASDPSAPVDELHVKYGITDVPTWWMTILLGFQTLLTMLGSTVLVPLLLVPAMGGSTADTAKVICTCFFASGINTLLQTLLGARLPIVQGGSFAYISPVLILAASIKSDPSNTFATDQDRFVYTMRYVQGGIIGSALIALGLALFSVYLWMLKHLSPITIAVNISILGLSLFNSGWPVMATCIQLGLPVVVLIITFAFYMRRIKIFGLAVFALFPVVLGLGITWLYAYIFTVAGVYDSSSPQTQAACTTSNAIIDETPWIRLPYPGQWGAPIMSWQSTVTLLAAVIPASLESIGDYYACARLSGAPQPPTEVVSRALGVEALCCLVAGLFGTGSGSTAYAENVGAISITGVASRRVTQVGAAIMMLLGIIGKFGALFASIPQALVAGMFTIMFSLISGVGFSNLESVSLQSQRNFFILGFGLYCGLSVPAYFEQYTVANKHGPVNTGSDTFNAICNSLFGTPAAVALMATVLLDVTISADHGERSKEAWQQQDRAAEGAWWEDPRMERLYGWPLGLTPTFRRRVDPIKESAWRALARAAAILDCRRCWRVQRQRPTGAAAPPAVLPLADVPFAAPQQVSSATEP